MTSLSVSAGMLRHKVVLQTETQGRGDAGGVTRSWASDASYPDHWAQVRPVGARENVSGDQITQNTTHLIRLRGILGFTFTPSMRFLWGSRIFNIEKVLNAQERDVLIEITAIEDLNA